MGGEVQVERTDVSRCTELLSPPSAILVSLKRRAVSVTPLVFVLAWLVVLTLQEACDL